jgi:hypothetical protein
MKTQGHVEVMLRFLRTVIVIDVILTGIVALISFSLGWRTAETYGTALLRMGMLVILFACFIGVGGYSARAGDIGAYSISRAGNMSENLMRIAESGKSSLGCFFLLLASGLGLMAIGYLLPLALVLIEYLFGSKS